MSSKGPFQVGKTSNIRIFSTCRFFTIFLKIAIFEIFGKIKNVPLKHVNPCSIHFLRHENEKYTSKELYYTIYEDKQVTTVAQFRFQCQILTTKITKSVDDF